MGLAAFVVRRTLERAETPRGRVVLRVIQTELKSGYDEKRARYRRHAPSEAVGESWSPPGIASVTWAPLWTWRAAIVPFIETCVVVA